MALLASAEHPSECVGFDPSVARSPPPPRHCSNAEQIENKPLFFNGLRCF
jgi:hypothetical protein